MTGREHLLFYGRLKNLKGEVPILCMDASPLQPSRWIQRAHGAAPHDAYSSSTHLSNRPFAVAMQALQKAADKALKSVNLFSNNIGDKQVRRSSMH